MAGGGDILDLGGMKGREFGGGADFTGKADFSIASQLLIQAEGVVITIVWSAVVAAMAYKIADTVVGLRMPEDAEREGLDIRSHGETAYNA